MRCKACGNDWRALSEDAPLELGEGVAAAASPSFNALPAHVEETAQEEAAPPPLTQTFRARAAQKHRTQRAIKQGLAWGLMVVLMLCGFLCAYIWRDAIVRSVPRLASVYQLVGIETNPVGLNFEVIDTGFANNDISQIYISGALRNVRDREVVVPPIRIALMDQNGHEYDHHILRLDEPPVLPGAVQGFAIILPNAEGRFAETRVELVWQEEARPRPVPEKSPDAKAGRQAPAAPVVTGSEPQPATTAPPTPATTAPAAPKATPAKSEATQPADPATARVEPVSSNPISDGLRRIKRLTTSQAS